MLSSQFSIFSNLVLALVLKLGKGGGATVPCHYYNINESHQDTFYSLSSLNFPYPFLIPHHLPQPKRPSLLPYLKRVEDDVFGKLQHTLTHPSGGTVDTHEERKNLTRRNIGN